MAETALAALEAKWATGLTRVDGRHVSEIGLVARDGSRRVFSGDAGDDIWQETYADALGELASEALTGRTATVFAARVLDPLAGRPARSIADLAFQFGVTPKRIYKVLDHAKIKIMELIIERASRAKAPLGESCPTCGRVYSQGNLSTCLRGYGHMAQLSRSASIHPECLPPRWRRPFRNKSAPEGGKQPLPAT